MRNLWQSEFVGEITDIKQLVADRHTLRIVTGKIQYTEGIKRSQLSSTL